MAKQLKDALDVISAAITSSSAINNYCTTKYSKKPKLFIGIDPHDPPQFENAPLIYVDIGGRMREQNGVHVQHAVRIACVVKSETVTVVGDVTRLSGIDDADAFAYLVEKAVSDALVAAAFSFNSEMGEPDGPTLPYFQSEWIYIIRCTNRLAV